MNKFAKEFEINFKHRCPWLIYSNVLKYAWEVHGLDKARKSYRCDGVLAMPPPRCLKPIIRVPTPA